MATTAETLSALQSLQVDAEAAARALRHFALELAAMRVAVLHSQQLPAVGPALHAQARSVGDGTAGRMDQAVVTSAYSSRYRSFCK